MERRLDAYARKDSRARPMDRPCEVTVKRLTRHVHSDWLHDAGCWSLVAGCWLLRHCQRAALAVASTAVPLRKAPVI